MACKMFSEEELLQATQKKHSSIGMKSLYSNTFYGFEYEKTA